MVSKKKKKKKNTPSPLGKRSMFQRGLGLFIRFEISKDSIRCNDENFMRWGECFFTRFFKFLCLGEAGWPENRFETEFGIASKDSKQCKNTSRKPWLISSKIDLLQTRSGVVRQHTIPGQCAPPPPQTGIEI
jgi:hypothetical protein